MADEPSTPEEQTGVSEQLEQLESRYQAGEITSFEYQSCKKKLMAVQKSQQASAWVAEAQAPAEPPPGEGGGGEAQEEESGEFHGPEGWREPSGRGPKRWSEGARGDDPEVRTVYPPTAEGIGTGQAFYFLFGLKRAREIDQKMISEETEHIQDDIEVLRQAGYTVVLDPQGAREDFFAVIYGEDPSTPGLAPAGFYWSAHGFPEGEIECCDGSRIRPDEVDPQRVSPNLRLAIFGACYVGSRSRTWREALGGRPLVMGWGRPVTLGRSVSFLDSNPETNTDLDDLIQRYLLTDSPLPGSPGGDRYSPVEETSAHGHLADLPQRMRLVSEMLCAQWERGQRCIDVAVPLTDRRSHRAKVFVTPGTEPFSEGELLLAVEADVGELTALVDPAMLLGGLSVASYARVGLVKSETDMPRIVAQGFLPFARVRDQDLAALVFQVCVVADELERRIFGTDDH